MPLEPPPVDKHYKDFASAFRACQKHARCQGYAMVRLRPCNYDNDGMPRRYDFACAYGGSRAHSSTSTGLRKSATRKTGCPFKMKVVQKKVFNNAWVADVVCPDHNHGPEDPAKFPEHRVGSLRRRHFKKIKELSQDGKMTARGIRDALRADDPHLLVNEIDIANLLRELRVLEKEMENGDTSVTTSRRRNRHFLSLTQDDDDEEEESSPEPMPEPVPEVSAEESELHRTLLALVPRIVQETIASLPMAPPQHVAAVAAAATARLRDAAIPQLHAQQQLQQQQQQQPQPQQQQQFQPQEYQQQQYQQQPQQPQHQHQQPQPHQQQQHLQQMQMQQQQMPQSPFQQPPQQQQPQPSPQPQPQPQQQQQPQVPAYYRSVEQAPGTEAPSAGFGILVPNQGMQRPST